MNATSAMLEQSAIRRRLSHDLRASMFNIEGFLKELKLVISGLEDLIDDNQGALPPAFVESARELLKSDANVCIECLDTAADQLQERVDLMTLSVEAPTE